MFSDNQTPISLKVQPGGSICGELRVNECDRIHIMAGGVTVLGINRQVLEDDILLNGGKIGSVCINGQGAHHIATLQSLR